MPQYPLLIFPRPTRIERARRFGGVGKIRFPEPSQQAERLVPQFQRLQEVLSRQGLILQDNTLGIQPELVLVLETVGSVGNFMNAIRKVRGLEWLAEFEVDDVVPEYGFEDESDREKHLTGQLFLVMTDYTALQQLLSLFELWKKDPSADFPHGLAPLKHAFHQLLTIRPWDAEDRLRDTGVLEDWRDRVRHGQEIVPFELELWYREDRDRRRNAEAYLKTVIESLDGKIVQNSTIPEISYHGILATIPVTGVTKVLSGATALAEFRLLQCQDIMYVRPVGQCAIRVLEDSSDLQAYSKESGVDRPSGDPVIALLDGLPLTKHRLLDGRLIVDDPDGYESDYQAHERVHGTAMASLVSHGDLAETSGSARRPVYVRPIMKPKRGFDGAFEEAMEESVLPVDLIYRAVKRLYDGEAGEPPVAPTIRVINLSVCDRARPFDRAMSSWARLLDWLSWKYGVLFVVSAGNHHYRDIELEVPRGSFRSLPETQRDRVVIRALAEDTRHRRLLSPAETINGLTVGAIHSDASSSPVNPSLLDPLSATTLPSPINAHGPGYRRAIKPDILLPGGKQLFAEKLGNTHAREILQARCYNRVPGQCVAAPGIAGELDRTMYTRGTSNAAALASYWAGFLMDVIEQIRIQDRAGLPPEYDVVLLKALLVHGAEWGNAGSLYQAALRDRSTPQTLKDYVGRFLGYGAANVQKVMACTEQRVTVLGVGKLEDGEADEFVFPLPPSLSAVAEKRRLTITLAWLSPVDCRRQKYRIAHLWFNPKNAIAPTRVCYDDKAVQRGTVQHEVLEGSMAVDFQDGDSIAITVNCRADAGRIVEPVRYALAVTLEVAEGIDIPIYQEVRDRLRVRLPVSP